MLIIFVNKHVKDIFKSKTLGYTVEMTRDLHKMNTEQLDSFSMNEQIKSKSAVISYFGTLI